jgi:glutamate racemase
LKHRPIGIFDSGLGGLTVVKAVQRELPKERLIYFGDTARIPYGTKSPDTIIRYARQIIRFFRRIGRVKCVVVACNTSSAWALEAVRREFPIPILGVIEPGADAALEATRNGRIGVIGTEGTIASGAYARTLHRLRPGVEVYSRACPLFVPLVEEGKLTGPIPEAVAREYLAPLLKKRIDTLVLGCTHYPLLKKTLARVAGGRVRIVDSAEETARSLRRNLESHGIELSGRGGGTFYVSDFSRRFREQAQRFLGRNIPRVRKVLIEDY